MHTTLAAWDSWTIGLEVVHFVAYALLSFAMWRIAQATKRAEHMEEALKKAGEKRIDDHFSLVEERLKSQVTAVARDVHDIADRLRRGDTEFEELGDKGQKLEVRLAQQTGDLKAYMAETFATRSDVKDVAVKIEWLAGAFAQASGIKRTA